MICLKSRDRPLPLRDRIQTVDDQDAGILGGTHRYETVGHGQPCPNCGASITEITAGQRITNFCRHCQT